MIRQHSRLGATQTIRGLTLIEVLVGLVLLLIVSAALLGLLPALAASNRDSEQEQRATLAAKSLYETVRATLHSDFNADLSPLSTSVSGQDLTCRVKSNVVDSTASSATEKETVPPHERTGTLPTQRAKSLLRRVTVECTGPSKTSTYVLDIARMP